MAEAIVMPALEMAQETGVLVKWLKQDGEKVEKGEPIMEVETDKATVEIESPAAGVLGGILAGEGDVVPVGQTIAWILAPGEKPPVDPPSAASGRARTTGASNTNGRTAKDKPVQVPGPDNGRRRSPSGSAVAKPAVSDLKESGRWAVTPLARNFAEENGVDLAKVTPSGNRIEKADVIAHMGAQAAAGGHAAGGKALVLASPKARRIAKERGVDIRELAGSGPDGAILAADITSTAPAHSANVASLGETAYETPGTLWRIMSDRMSESWATVPHFYLVREVNATRLLEWRQRSGQEIEERTGARLTVTDLLVKAVGTVLKRHPRLNGSWDKGRIRLNGEVNVGIAAALEDGLVVPVIANADSTPLAEIASIRTDLIARARERKLRPEDISEGTFTITNLGMFNVDAFNAIVNPPQAAILAVGRIADRVVPIDGKPEIRPMVVLTLSCDHRVVDGARAARFLDELATTLEDPWRLLV